MKIFLKLKNWELFILICVLPFAFSLIIKVIVNNLFLVVLQYIFSVLGSAALFLWMYSIKSQIAGNFTKGKYKLAKIIETIIISIILIIIIVLTYVSVVGDITSIRSVIIFPIGMLLLFSYIYSTISTAIYLKRYELGETAILTIEEYGSTFNLLVLFPIGIWVLQPKINQIRMK